MGKTSSGVHCSLQIENAGVLIYRDFHENPQSADFKAHELRLLLQLEYALAENIFVEVARHVPENTCDGHRKRNKK